MLRRFGFIGAILVFWVSLDSSAFTTAFELSFGPNDVMDAGKAGDWSLALNEGRSSGHEEITRQAMNIARKRLDDNTRIDLSREGRALLRDLEPRWRGTIGASTTNTIIKGNYCTDMPTERTAAFSLPEFWFGSEGAKKDWHNDPDTQTVHFLRAHTAKGLASARNSCLDARKKIVQATLAGAREWQEGRKERAMFLIGHATHILQDSFAPAHTARAGRERNFDLVDLCYYGSGKRSQLQSKNLPDSSCYHAVVDLEGDSIWIRTNAQLAKVRQDFPHEESSLCDPFTKHYFFTEKSKRECLRSEARMARDATARYLYILATDIHEHRKRGLKYDSTEFQKLSDRLFRELFEGTEEIREMSNTMPLGVLRCNELKK